LIISLSWHLLARTNQPRLIICKAQPIMCFIML